MSVRYLAENYLTAGTGGRLGLFVGTIVTFVSAVSQSNPPAGDDPKTPLPIALFLCGSMLVGGPFGAMVLAPVFSVLRVLVKYTLFRDLPDDPTVDPYDDLYWD